MILLQIYYYLITQKKDFKKNRIKRKFIRRID